MENKSGSTLETPKKQWHWDELYVLSEHWRSDLCFYRDDLKFLHHLVDRYLIWITKKENLDAVQGIMQKLLALEKECLQLLDRTGLHMIQLGKQASNETENFLSESARDDHLELEAQLARFVKDFRENRKEVFRITEYVIDSEQLSNILR